MITVMNISTELITWKRRSTEKNSDYSDYESSPFITI